MYVKNDAENMHAPKLQPKKVPVRIRNMLQMPTLVKCEMIHIKKTYHKTSPNYIYLNFFVIKIYLTSLL